jgi:predicted Zn finger-like uncharacterized protein
MSAITQCPQCHTHFKVSQEQIELRQGMVRCGRCHAAFNATEHMHQAATSTPPETPEVASAPQERPEVAISATGVSAAEPVVNPPDITDAPGGTVQGNTIKRKRRGWWIATCLLLVIVLLAQAGYFFRVELAARLPGLKPILVSYCELLGCTVPLPQQADLMSIESSELEVADPAQPSVITLNAILRNHAAYAQAYPNLELALTDADDKVVARRTFVPAEYLPPENNAARGIAAEREASLKLRLDTADLKPTGYRLLLFYAP